METHSDPKRCTILALAVAATVWGAATAPAGAAPTPAHPAGPLTFGQDDYPRALAEARAKNSPLFLDFWAPW